ncbi:MAG: hypothetical protein NTV23_01845 [Propionibacteriales bacterium]|nr:hypothetical protein [Propionibacteriales bacterium]
MTSTSEHPRAASRMKAAALIVLAGAGTGIVSVGLLSRLGMFLLARLNPDADGVTSDDGFEMGRFTLSGSLNLVVLGALLGAVSGVLYLALERLRFGPEWFRTLSLGVGAGTVAATQVVHADGVDFHLLEPLWLAVAVFVAIPVLHVAALDRAAVRVRVRRSVPVPAASGTLAWLLRLALAVLFAVAVASLVGDLRTVSGGEG